MMLRSLLSLVLSFTLCVAASAAEQRLLTPQDLWAIKRVGSPAVSPDGKHVVFTLQEWSIDKNKSTTNLWTVPVAGGETRRLTTAETSEDAPVGAPTARASRFSRSAARMRTPRFT